MNGELFAATTPAVSDCNAMELVTQSPTLIVHSLFLLLCIQYRYQDFKRSTIYTQQPAHLCLTTRTFMPDNSTFMPDNQNIYADNSTFMPDNQNIHKLLSTCPKEDLLTKCCCHSNASILPILALPRETIGIHKLYWSHFYLMEMT